MGLYVESSIEMNAAFDRSIESFGRGLVLIRVDCSSKAPSPYHRLFENGRKPPLDVAIDSQNGLVSYIKLFIQDDELKCSDGLQEVELLDGLPVFNISDFSFDNYQVFENVDFKMYFDDVNIVILSEQTESYKGYSLGNDNLVLVNANKKFVGLVLRQVSKKELDELKKAEII